MTYNVFGGTLNLAQPALCVCLSAPKLNRQLWRSTGNTAI